MYLLRRFFENKSCSKLHFWLLLRWYFFLLHCIRQTLYVADTAAFFWNISKWIYCKVFLQTTHLAQTFNHVNLVDVFLLPPTMFSEFYTFHRHIVDSDLMHLGAINTPVPTHMHSHASNTFPNGFTSYLDDVDDSCILKHTHLQSIPHTNTYKDTHTHPYTLCNSPHLK